MAEQMLPIFDLNESSNLHVCPAASSADENTSVCEEVANYHYGNFLKISHHSEHLNDLQNQELTQMDDELTEHNNRLQILRNVIKRNKQIEFDEVNASLARLLVKEKTLIEKLSVEEMKRVVAESTSAQSSITSISGNSLIDNFYNIEPKKLPDDESVNAIINCVYKLELNDSTNTVVFNDTQESVDSIYEASHVATSPTREATSDMTNLEEELRRAGENHSDKTSPLSNAKSLLTGSISATNLNDLTECGHSSAQSQEQRIIELQRQVDNEIAKHRVTCEAVQTMLARLNYHNVNERKPNQRWLADFNAEALKYHIWSKQF